MDKLLLELGKQETFSIEEAFAAYRQQGGELDRPSFERKWDRAALRGDVIRVGRGRFCVASGARQPYRWTYSQAAVELVRFIREKTWEVKLTLFELRQLNEFANHLIAHNVLFLSVEKDCVQSVFETLHEKFPGRVLLKPSVEDYFNYLVEGLIVVQELRPDAPNVGRKQYAAPPEKWLVELYADPVRVSCVGATDRALVVKGMLEKFVLNEQRLARYARRRGHYDDFKAELHA